MAESSSFDPARPHSDEFPDGRWRQEVTLEVTVEVDVWPGPHHEADQDYGRTPATLAQTMVYLGREDPSRVDGYADLEGSVVITSVQEL